MRWEVRFCVEFDAEFYDLNSGVQVELLACTELLACFGPSLGRPRVDTLNGSKHTKMKELRFHADGGVWRIAFAFDPQRKAVLLIAGNKAGTKQRQFYRSLITTADRWFDAHLRKIARQLLN